MMEPNHPGPPAPTKDSLEDLVASYFFYKSHLEALTSRDGLRYACVPGMDVEITMNSLDEGMLLFWMGMHHIKLQRIRTGLKGA